MRRIAFACLKGGSSKTTTAVAVAVCLARRGNRVLLIDADQQANATWTMTGGQGADSPTLAEVLMRQASAEETIRPSTVPGVDLLPAASALGGVNVALAQELARDTRLRSAMMPLDGRWDYVLCDTGPSFTTLLANVLVYCEEVVVPTDAGVYAVLGLVELERIVDEVRGAYNPRLHVAGVVLTRVARNNTARDVEAGLRERLGDRVYRATVPLAAIVEQAHTNAKSVVEFAPKSPAAVAYEALTVEVVEHGRTKGSGDDAGQRARTGDAA